MVVIRANRRNVRILLVGDRGVGKTSLILSLVCEIFPEEVPARAEEIIIPADVTPEQVPTLIVDYSAAEQSDENLAEEIQKANVICVVYAVNDEETIERVTSYWLPLIRECSYQRCPVVLAGNKVDLVDYSTMDAGFSIMEEFSEIESCIQCSAKTLTNISELFFYAQKAVLHPTGPLYIIETEELTESCQAALRRIFKICDIDNDGLLNDFELNNFQTRCFKTPLQPQVIEDVKAVVKSKIPDGIQKDSVTLSGFLFLHKLFIQRGRNETIWSVLRKFGYNDNLQMSKDYLYPTLKVPSSSTTELSHKGQQFLQYLFERHDKDKDGALSPKEEEDLFSTCPTPPWGIEAYYNVPTNQMGWLTMQGFICQWTLMTMLDVSKSMEYLAYLGYNIMENESQISAINVTREKKIDLLKRNSSRTVYVCHVIGPKFCGKTQFCQSFIGNVLQDIKAPKYTINNIQVYGQEKYLILREIEMRSMTDPLLPSEVQCDVACLMYDYSSPKSFEYAARIFIKYFAESKIPVLMVANKADLTEAKQDYLLPPEIFCKKYKIMPPQHFSINHSHKKEVFVKLATMAAFPRFQAAWLRFYKNSTMRRMVQMLSLRPQPSEWLLSIYRHLRQFSLIQYDSNVWWKAGLGLAAATAFGYMVLKVLHTDKLR